jgi:DNA-binding GntR family transcriptional regulator
MAEVELATGLRLQRESTAEQVAGLLREQILTGRMEPDAHLRESAVSDALGVSRNTVREAIQMLVSQGLVKRSMHRGAFVARLTPEDVRDLYRVRRLVELAATADAAKPGADLSALQDAVAALAAVADQGDLAGIVEQDLRFHLGLVETTRSPRLKSLWESAEGETRLCLTVIDAAYVEPQQLVAEHRELLDALRAHDEERSRALLRAHLDEAENSIVEMLQRREAQPGA